MAVTGLHFGGSVGEQLDARHVTAADAKAHIAAFLATAQPAGSNTRLQLDGSTFGMTYEHNLTWSFRFAAEVKAPDGSSMGRRRFEGRYDPEGGGIAVQEVTARAFAVNYYKDTRG